MHTRKFIVLLITWVITFCLTEAALAMQIFVKTPAGETLSLTVEPSDTVESVKAQLQQTESVNPARQVLRFNNKVLDDTKTLADYNIQKECTLILTIIGNKWYICCQDDGENITYYKDTGEENYSQSNWSSAENGTSSILSGLLNSDNISSDDIVYILGGKTYLLESTITLGKTVSIYGGFSGHEQTINGRANSSSPTILSGQNSNQVLAITADVSLDGLTITQGRKDFGGGISISAGSPTITNCIITGNTATINGGGIYISGQSSPVITNCSITGNTAATNGGGFYVSGGSGPEPSAPVITNCSITGNTASDGGGLHISGNRTTEIMNCSIANNSANKASISNGGGICISGRNAVLKLTNCTITGNEATANGAGIHQSQFCTINILNCTIAYNLNAASGLELYNNSSKAYFTNSIVWNQNADTFITKTGLGPIVQFTNTNYAPSSSLTSGINTITSPEWNSPKTSEITVNGVTHTVYALADNPDLQSIVAAGTSTDAPSTDQLGVTRRLPPSVGAVEGAATYYVVKDGEGEYENIKYRKTSGEYNAQHWDEASVDGTLAAFLKESVEDDTVYVGKGYYTLSETLELGRNVKLLGGFAGSEAAFDERNSSSVLYGKRSVTIMSVTSDSEIDGFILETAKGFGMNIAGSPTITNCAISGTNGRGVYVSSGSPSFANCTVSSSTEEGVYVSSGSPSFTNCHISNNSKDGVHISSGTPSFMNCSIICKSSNSLGYTNVNAFGASSVTNSLVYGTSSGTGTFDHCALPEGFDSGNITDPVYISTWLPIASSQTVRGVAHSVFALTDNPALSVLAGAGTSSGAPATDILGVTRLNPPTIGTLEFPYDTSYTLTIPESLSIQGTGWNAVTGGISVKHDPANADRTFTPVKKLKISATSSNDWTLKSEHAQTIGYTLREADGGAAVTSWEFSPENINADGGTAKSLGADVADYTGKPAGEYTDTLTFTVSIENN